MEEEFDCGIDACDGPGPPPKFMIPPPPRPPSMHDTNLLANFECNEDPIADVNMCAAFPVSTEKLEIVNKTKSARPQFFTLNEQAAKLSINIQSAFRVSSEIARRTIVSFRLIIIIMAVGWERRNI